MKLVSKDKEGRLKYCSDLFLFSLAQERHRDSRQKSIRAVKGIRVCWRWQGVFSDLERVCALTSLQVLHSDAITRSLTQAQVRAGSSLALLPLKLTHHPVSSFSVVQDDQLLHPGSSFEGKG